MTNSKKIAVICNYELLPERVGGMDYFFWLFDKKCKENNYQVDWFFPNKSLHNGYSNLSIYSSNHKNVENYFLENYANDNYTHVFTHFVELCTPFFKKLKKISKASVIVVDHNPRPLLGYPLKKKIEKRVKGILYSKYIDLFIGVSNYTVNEIIKDFGKPLKKKSITIYNGVIINDIKARKNINVLDPIFLVASHLRKSKGIQDLIDAIYLLPLAVLDKIRIDVYGDGPYRNNLIEKVNEKKLENVIIFKGSVSNLKEIYCNYDYMIQPTHMECFSLSILESLAANVPVITTNVGGNQEVISNAENGFIFKAKDINALKIIIEEVYVGNKTISISTRDLIANNFSLDKMVDNYIKLLQ